MKNIRAIRMGGFTLIEVMVVVVILAILAAVVVPKIMSGRAGLAQTAVKDCAGAIGISFSVV